MLAGKTLFNFLLFLAMAAVTIPGFLLLLDWKPGSAGAVAATLLAGGFGLAVVSTFLSALVARAGQRHVLFVLIAFPLLLPLLQAAIAATIEAAAGTFPATPLKVLVAYDGAASCGAYMLAGRRLGRLTPDSDWTDAMNRNPEAPPAPLHGRRHRGRVPLAGARAGIHRRVVADRLLPRALRLDVHAGVPRRGGLLGGVPAHPQPLARRRRRGRGPDRASCSGS